MLGHSFYHRLIRKYVTAFGTLFNDIEITRRTNNNSRVEKMKVPISYASKEKFFSILNQDKNKNKKTQITLPRLSFNIEGYSYNPSTKLNTIQKFKQTNPADNNSFITAFSAVPYDISFSLNAFVRHTEDGTQIAEQIIPFFAPDFVVSLNLIDELNNPFDIPIVLNSVSNQDTFEGSYEDLRIINWNFTFTMKAMFIGPLSDTGKIIKSAVINTNSIPEERDSTITTQPRVENKTIDQINANDDFGFSTTTTNEN